MNVRNFQSLWIECKTLASKTISFQSTLFWLITNYSLRFMLVYTKLGYLFGVILMLVGVLIISAYVVYRPDYGHLCIFNTLQSYMPATFPFSSYMSLSFIAFKIQHGCQKICNALVTQFFLFWFVVWFNHLPSFSPKTVCKWIFFFGN